MRVVAEYSLVDGNSAYFPFFCFTKHFPSVWWKHKHLCDCICGINRGGGSCRAEGLGKWDCGGGVGPVCGPLQPLWVCFLLGCLSFTYRLAGYLCCKETGLCCKQSILLSDSGPELNFFGMQIIFPVASGESLCVVVLLHTILEQQGLQTLRGR